jgi:hypothetical protein
MNLPDINWRYLAIAIAIVIIVAVALAVIPSTLSAKTINAYFSPTNKVSPGQSTNLVIEMTNTLSKDVDSYGIQVNAVNQGIIVGEFSAPAGTIGQGEMRKVTVPISLSDELLEGTYSIEIKLDLAGEQFVSRVILEVKK